MSWFSRLYLRIDPRTLALSRVVMSMVLIGDLIKRWTALELWYGPDGLVPTDVAHAMNPDGVSMLWGVQSDLSLHLIFAGCAVAYLALLVGALTKLAQVASLACLVSLQARVQMLSNGGDYVLCILGWWMLLLPLGACISVDAWRRARARGLEGRVALLACDGGSTTSLAVFGATTNLAVIYLFNALHKSGATWMDGTAIHYTLWLDRVVTPLAVWYRGLVSPLGSKILTYATLAVEGSLPLLIMSPLGRPWTRRLAILFIVGLHGSISALLNVGIFSAAMMAFATLLVSTEDWELCRRLAARLGVRAARARPSAARVAARSMPRLALRECLAAAFVLVATVVTLNDNSAVPAAVKPRSLPRWLVRGVNAARVSQGWHMFSPDVGVDEVALIVRAVTARRITVDPIHPNAARQASFMLTVPVGQDHDVYWHHYELRMPPVEALRPALARWIRAYPERTGNPEDRIERFVVHLVRRRSPPPGEDYTLPPTSSELMRSDP